MTFGDHLRAHEQVDLSGVEAVKDAFEVVASTHGITIHAPDARGWEGGMQAVFDFLRAGTEKEDVLTLAFGADVWDTATVSAEVAFEARRAFVVRHGECAVAA